MKAMWIGPNQRPYHRLRPAQAYHTSAATLRQYDREASAKPNGHLFGVKSRDPQGTIQHLHGQDYSKVAHLFTGQVSRGSVRVDMDLDTMATVFSVFELQAMNKFSFIDPPMGQTASITASCKLTRDFNPEGAFLGFSFMTKDTKRHGPGLSTQHPVDIGPSRMVGEVEKGQSKVHLFSNLKDCSQDTMNMALQVLTAAFKKVVCFGGYTPPGNPSITSPQLGTMPHSTAADNLVGKIYPSKVFKHMKTTSNTKVLGAADMHLASGQLKDLDFVASVLLPGIDTPLSDTAIQWICNQSSGIPISFNRFGEEGRKVFKFLQQWHKGSFFIYTEHFFSKLPLGHFYQPIPEEHTIPQHRTPLEQGLVHFKSSCIFEHRAQVLYDASKEQMVGMEKNLSRALSSFYNLDAGLRTLQLYCWLGGEIYDGTETATSHSKFTSDAIYKPTPESPPEQFETLTACLNPKVISSMHHTVHKNSNFGIYGMKSLSMTNSFQDIGDDARAKLMEGHEGLEDCLFGDFW